VPNRLLALNRPPPLAPLAVRVLCPSGGEGPGCLEWALQPRYTWDDEGVTVRALDAAIPYAYEWFGSGQGQGGTASGQRGRGWEGARPSPDSASRTPSLVPSVQVREY